MSTLLNRSVLHDVYRTYYEGSPQDLEGRVPEVGSRAEFQDGRAYILCRTTQDITGIYPVSGSIPSPGWVVNGAHPSGVDVIKVSIPGGDNSHVGKLLLTTTGQNYKIKSNTSTTVTLENVLSMGLTSGSIVRVQDPGFTVYKTTTTTPLGIPATTLQLTGTPYSVGYLWVQIAGCTSIPVVDDTGMEEGVGLSVASSVVVATTGTAFAFARSNMESEGIIEGPATVPVILTLPPRY